MLNSFEEKLRERLKGYEENPAPDEWTQIEKRIQKPKYDGLDTLTTLSELGFLIFLVFMIFNNSGVSGSTTRVNNSASIVSFPKHDTLRTASPRAREQQPEATVGLSNSTPQRETTGTGDSNRSGNKQLGGVPNYVEHEPNSPKR